jgi:DNA-directed RNA polymerase specialized sigma24 family protein
VQATTHRDSVRQDLILMLPRLKRFADLLAGERKEGKAVLRRALFRMLDGHHRYQRGTSFDRWAFAEIYAAWLESLREHPEPLGQGKTDENFARLFYRDGEESFDLITADFLAQLPPQQRGTLLLVYGEGFDHDEAAMVLDTTRGAIEARLIRASAGLADRLDAPARARGDEAAIDRLCPATATARS